MREIRAGTPGLYLCSQVRAMGEKCGVLAHTFQGDPQGSNALLRRSLLGHLEQYSDRFAGIFRRLRSLQRRHYGV
jgi:hypothetical protein